MKHYISHPLLSQTRLAAQTLSFTGAIAGCLIAPLSLASFCAPALAQPAPEHPMSDQDKRLEFLNKTLIPTVPKDFEGALQALRDFIQANPNMERYQYVQVFANSGNYLYFRTPEDKRAAIADKALSVLDAGIDYVNTHKDARQEDQERDLVELSHNKLQVLIAAKRFDEAATVLDQTWPMVLRWGGNLDNWCRYWRAVRTAQNQPKQAVDGLIHAYEVRMPWRGESNTDISLPICDELMSQGRIDEALSWAKQSFEMCNFDESSIRSATQAVTKALTANELSVAKANGFAAAQTDPAAPNPLDAVKLPQYDTTAIRGQLTDPKASPRVRYMCLLAIGDYHGAMLQARNILMTDVGNEDNARQIARVFKARDADIARANQFLTYYQAGQGDNPIPTFLKETENGAPAVP